MVYTVSPAKACPSQQNYSRKSGRQETGLFTSLTRLQYNEPSLRRGLLYAGGSYGTDRDDPQTENLVIIPQDIVEPMDARLEEVVFLVAGAHYGSPD